MGGGEEGGEGLGHPLHTKEYIFLTDLTRQYNSTVRL